MISSSAFARFAVGVFANHAVPFKRGGSTLSGMDSAGFISYCLTQLGRSTKMSGTNDLMRNYTTQITPIGEARKQKLIQPGVLLLHVSLDGNVLPKYRDGQGNCDYAMICVDQEHGIYPSEKREGLIQTEFLKYNRITHIAHCKYVDYGNSSSSSVARPSISDSPINADEARLIGDGVRLRKGPSTSFDPLASMPIGSILKVVESRGEWTHVRYTNQYGTVFNGWCASQFLSK